MHIGRAAEPASAAQLLADEAVFRRTRKGQAELISECWQLTGAERRLLGSVTGHTPLRVLLDLGQMVGTGKAIFRLVDLGLVELVEQGTVNARAA